MIDQIDHTSPPNWVAARAKCNLDLTFDALFQIIQRDVSEMNKLSETRRRGYSFDIEQNGEGLHPSIRVRRFPEQDPDGNKILWVTFTKSTAAIRIESPLGEVELAYPQWEESSCSCRLHIDGKRYRAWEVCQRALGPLFFEGNCSPPCVRL